MKRVHNDDDYCNNWALSSDLAPGSGVTPPPFPKEIWEKIFSFFRTDDLVRCIPVDTFFRSLAFDAIYERLYAAPRVGEHFRYESGMHVSVGIRETRQGSRLSHDRFVRHAKWMPCTPPTSDAGTSGTFSLTSTQNLRSLMVDFSCRPVCDVLFSRVHNAEFKNMDRCSRCHTFDGTFPLQDFFADDANHGYRIGSQVTRLGVNISQRLDYASALDRVLAPLEKGLTNLRRLDLTLNRDAPGTDPLVACASRLTSLECLSVSVGDGVDILSAVYGLTRVTDLAIRQEYGMRISGGATPLTGMTWLRSLTLHSGGVPHGTNAASVLLHMMPTSLESLHLDLYSFGFRNRDPPAVLEKLTSLHVKCLISDNDDGAFVPRLPSLRVLTVDSGSVIGPTSLICGSVLRTSLQRLEILADDYKYGYPNGDASTDGFWYVLCSLRAACPPTVVLVLHPRIVSEKAAVLRALNHLDVLATTPTVPNGLPPSCREILVSYSGMTFAAWTRERGLLILRPDTKRESSLAYSPMKDVAC